MRAQEVNIINCTSLHMNKISALPESGNELKSPQSSSCTLEASDLCPCLNDWPAWSRMDLSSLPSIIVWMSLTSQNSGSQWRWAVQTRIGCCTWAGSEGTPFARKENQLGDIYRISGWAMRVRLPQ